MCVEQLADGDVDDRLVEDDHLGVLIDVEALPWLRHVTRRAQELSGKGE